MPTLDNPPGNTSDRQLDRNQDHVQHDNETGLARTVDQLQFRRMRKYRLGDERLTPINQGPAHGRRNPRGLIGMFLVVEPLLASVLAVLAIEVTAESALLRFDWSALSSTWLALFSAVPAGAAASRYNIALRGNGEALMEGDAEVRALAKDVKRLDVADNGLCFGRLDSLSGETSYIGRIGLLDADHDYEPVLLDWRAPTSRAFYVATAANPENMRRRRQFRTRSRHVVDFTDEALGRPDGVEHEAQRLRPACGSQRTPR